MNKAEDLRGMPLSEIVSDNIIQYIMERGLEPGDRLPTEYELAKTLGVSRSTVREAVRRLVTRNILSVRQGSGTFVSQNMGVPEDPLGIEFMRNDKKLIIDLLDVRLMLEPEIAALAAVNATEEQIQQLSYEHQRVGEAIQNGEDHSELDANFHKLLADFSGNSALAKLIPIITSSVNIVIGGTNDALKKDVQQQHGHILDAVSRRDASGARMMMISHLCSNREYIITNT